MDLTKLVEQIVSYNKNESWDDIIDTLFNNKDLLIKWLEEYLEDHRNKRKFANNSKSNDSLSRNNTPKTEQPINMLWTYSETLFESSKDSNKFAFLRLMILKLVEIKHEIKLKEGDEVRLPITKVTYITTIADNEIKTKLFILYLIFYYFECEIRSLVFESLLNKRPHVGIDYEFNQRKIALMQINFESVADAKENTNSYIWLVNPGEFDKDNHEMLIKLLMTNKRVYKILHGPDSLDIPYMYDTMFEKDKPTILDFTRKILDTRFLCDYLRRSLGEDGKCSIYDALLYFGTITQDKYSELLYIHESMGPVQDINWNIHKMSSFHIKYALYDVLFLQHFLIDIFKKIRTETPQLVNSYNFVNPVIRFTFLERREVTDITETAKKVINPINNYLIKYRDKKITLITIYNEVIENFKIPEKGVDINFLLSVGYFGKTLSILFKYIVYYIVRENFDVYENKNVRMKDKISLDPIYEKLREDDFLKIIHLLNLFQNEARKKILTLYI